LAWCIDHAILCARGVPTATKAILIFGNKCGGLQTPEAISPRIPKTKCANARNLGERSYTSRKLARNRRSPSMETLEESVVRGVEINPTFCANKVILLKF
jgi:hypothetical protein